MNYEDFFDEKGFLDEKALRRYVCSKMKEDERQRCIRENYWKAHLKIITNIIKVLYIVAKFIIWPAPTWVGLFGRENTCDVDDLRAITLVILLISSVFVITPINMLATGHVNLLWAPLVCFVYAINMWISIYFAWVSCIAERLTDDK